VIFPIQEFRLLRPAPSLGARPFRLKTIIPILLIGPSTQRFGNVLVDSGADDVVFPEVLAQHLGIDLTTAPLSSARTQLGGGHSTLRYARIILRLTDGLQVCRWRAVVAFAQMPPTYGLFGIAGGLEHFRTTMDFQSREMTFDPLPTLPHTTDAFP
jgi:hypothetical protein